MESAEKTPWIDPIRPPGRDLTRAAARVAHRHAAGCITDEGMQILLFCA